MNLGQHIQINQRTEMGFVGFDLEGSIIYSSKKLLQILNISDDTTINVHDLFQSHSTLLDAAVDAVQGKSSKLEVSIHDKTYLVEMLTYSPLVEEADVVAIFCDITELKLKELALNERISELNERNIALEKLAYITSHDLNEPLRTVSNFANLLQKNHASQLDEKAGKYLEFVGDGAKRAQLLLDNLLGYNRASRAELNIHELYAEDIIHLQAYHLRDKIAMDNVVIDIESESAIEADSHWIGEVFKQLLKNAIIHNESDAPQINITIDQVKDEYIISVSDNGVGIEKEYEKDIFQLMNRADKRPDLTGSGIGLSICQKIINLHGGKIWLDTQASQGSKFIFSLPRRKS